MAAFECRLCQVSVPRHRAIDLFGPKAVKERLSFRVTELLHVPVGASDGLPAYICEKCKRKLDRLERAEEELKDFRRQATRTYTELGLKRRELKRTKETSSAVGVSPDTAKNRPPSKKLSRRHLDFEQVSQQPPCLPSLLSSVVPSVSITIAEPLPQYAVPLIVAEPLPLYACSQENQPPPPSTKKTQCHKVQISVTDISGSSTTTVTLSETTSAIGKALASEHLPSVAGAILEQGELCDIVIHLFMEKINSECFSICQHSKPLSPFHKIDAGKCSTFQWKKFIENLSQKAPTLLKVLSSIVTYNDHRKKKPVSSAHHPGLCMAIAILLKERNREMCGLQSIISLLLYSAHVDKQVYSRLNHVGVCMSYTGTLNLLDEVSKLHTLPLSKWIGNDILFKFWGDNVDKQRGVRDVRSDHHGSMLHMYSILAGRSRTPCQDLSRTGCVCPLSQLHAHRFLPTSADVTAVRRNLVVLVSRIITQYIDGLSVLSKAVPQHIQHPFSKEMGVKSEVIVLDVLMKNEAKRSDMIDIMHCMQNYLGEEYPSERRVLSGGDQLTCERQVGAQRHTMDGDAVGDRLGLLEPVTEDWHCLVCLLSVVWKKLYSQSAREHGTLGYFRGLLHRNTVKADVKKSVDANLEFLSTVFRGHVLACACKILEISSLDGTVHLPPALTRTATPTQQQYQFVQRIASQIVEQCTLINTCEDIPECDDKVYNYARVLCHYSAIITEFRDAWAEGDGERVFRCWRLTLPHFKSSGHTKYSLEALRLQFQVKSLLSPQLAHQVLWDRFVNTRGGPGRNIPCDLYNEHVVRLIKSVITSMGANLTEKALQRAARSVSTLHCVCKQFDSESSVPITTSAHSTRTDKNDIQTVVKAVIDNDLLTVKSGRSHRNFHTMRLNPLWNWDKDSTLKWIEKKKTDFLKYRRISGDGEVENEIDDDTGSDGSL